MGHKYSQEEKEMYKRIDEVLHYIWDPIGVAGVPEARDEYYGYIPKVFMLVGMGDKEEEIAQYLNNVQKESMGLSANLSKCREAAHIIVHWKTVIDARGPRLGSGINL